MSRTMKPCAVRRRAYPLPSSKIERCKSACGTGISEQSEILRRFDQDSCSERRTIRVAAAIGARVRVIARSDRFGGFGVLFVVL
jgi:hypothetical protein